MLDPQKSKICWSNRSGKRLQERRWNHQQLHSRLSELSKAYSQNSTAENAHNQNLLGPGGLNVHGNKNHDCNERTVSQDIGYREIGPECDLK